MKKLMQLILICLLFTFSVAGCGVETDRQAGGTAGLEPEEGVAGETESALYEAALAESPLMIYTTTTRIFETKQAFEEQYPGLTVEVQAMRSADIFQLLEQGHERKEFLCDLLVAPDVELTLSRSFLQRGILYKYVPSAIEASIIPEHNGPVLNFSREGAQLFYNSTMYDSPPVANWWELTQPQYQGRLCMVDPLRSHTTNALLYTVIQQSAEMADAYEELYGKPLSIPEGSSAGEEFWKKLMENEVRFTSSSEEALELVGTSWMEEPYLAIMVSSKERKSELGYAIEPIYDMAPFTGAFVENCVMVSSDATSSNAAKLFIHFLLGGEDGSGEGYKPFLKEGSWSVRTDVRGESRISAEEAGFYTFDKEYFVENQAEIETFWREIRRSAYEPDHIAE